VFFQNSSVSKDFQRFQPLFSSLSHTSHVYVKNLSKARLELEASNATGDQKTSLHREIFIIKFNIKMRKPDLLREPHFFACRSQMFCERPLASPKQRASFENQLLKSLSRIRIILLY